MSTRLLLALIFSSPLAAQITRIPLPQELNPPSKPASELTSKPTKAPQPSSPNTPESLQSLLDENQQKKMGLSNLNKEQWSALNAWFDQHQTNQSSQLGDQDVQMVLSEGHYVQLGSGEVWNINANAWLYTYYWRKGDPIEIGQSQDTLFPVQLTNKNSGQSVTAQKASKDVQDAFTHPQVIKEISNEGQFIKLSNGSVWQVEPSTRYMSQGWSLGSPVYVVKNQHNTGPLTYELFNGETSRSVFASQTSAATPPKPAKTKTKTPPQNAPTNTPSSKSKS